MKKNQKLSSSLGVTMNRIQAELDYVQTDAYLNSLMRKLEHESHSNLNSNNDKK